MAKWQYFTVIALGAIALVLVFANIMLHSNNMAIQSEINFRQQYINQTIKLSRINVQLIQTLANVSARTKDPGIKRLLASQGISYTVNPTSPQPISKLEEAQKSALSTNKKSSKR